MSNTINWSSYNKSLVNRGAITFWISDDVFQAWYGDNVKRRRGAPQIYSDLTIKTLSILRFKYKLTLRETQGFAESIIQLMDLTYLWVPDYSTLSRRLAKLDISIERKLSNNRPLHIVVDSTGLKVYGEGEWKVKVHGVSKRRTWRKLHLGVDESNNQICAAVVTTNDFRDSELLEDILEDIDESIDQVTGDGGYDADNCYQSTVSIGARPIFVPRYDAVIQQHGNSKGVPLDRDENLRGIRKYGRSSWKKRNNYHRRSLAETAMFRLKILTGDRVSSRDFDRQANELFLRVNILNAMITPSVI